MLNLSRFTRFSWGKLLKEKFALCKEIDISQLWTKYMIRMSLWCLNLYDRSFSPWRVANGICIFVFRAIWPSEALSKETHWDTCTFLISHLWIVSRMSLLVCDSCGWSYSVYFNKTWGQIWKAHLQLQLFFWGWRSCDRQIVGANKIPELSKWLVFP